MDGIRGIAILLVLIYHCADFRAGNWVDDYFYMFTKSLWIGVDLFFVLSGFLITRILIATRNAPNYFSSFYARRALRIFPLYYLFLIFVIFIAPEINYLNRIGATEVGDKQWWYWLYLSNFLAAKEAALRHLFLGPTWSLAIEEQFYLVWPLIVWLTRVRLLIWISFALILIAAFLRPLLLELGVPANSIYVLTFTRMDTLATGAFVACLMSIAGAKQRLKSLVPWILFGLMLALIVFMSFGLVNKRQTSMVYYGYTLVTLAFGALVLLTATLSERSLIHRMLTGRFLLMAGKYSYAVYLFNRPLVPIIEKSIFNPKTFPTFLGSHIPGQIIFTLILIGLSFGLAFLSWHLFERWFLKLKVYFPAGAKS